MDGPGDHVLAGAGFAGDQHRRIVAGRQPDQFRHLPQPPFRPDEHVFPALLPVLEGLDALDPFEFLGPDDLLDHHPQFLDLDRFGEVITDSAPQRRQNVVKTGIGGDEDDLGEIVDLKQGRAEIDAVAIRQVLVEEHHVDPLLSPQSLPFGHRLGGEDVEVPAGEIGPDQIAEKTVIIDYQQDLTGQSAHRRPPPAALR